MKESVVQNKVPKLFFIMGILLILIGGGFALSDIFIINEEKVVEKEINMVFENAKSTISLLDNKKLEYDLEKDFLGMTGNLSISSDYKSDSVDLQKLSAYKLNYGGVIAKSNNKASGYAILVENDKNIIELKSYIEGKKALISLGDLYNKTVLTELEDEIKNMKLSKSLNTHDLNYLIEKTEKITKNYTKDDIKKETEEKEIAGKKAEYTKISYTIKINDYLTTVLTEYKSDEKVIDILSNLYNGTKEEMNKTIDDKLEELKEDTTTDELVVNMYLDGAFNKIKELDYVYRAISSYSQDETTLQIIVNDNNYDFKVYDSDKKCTVSGNYDSNKNIMNVDFEPDDKAVKRNMTIEGNDNNLKMEYVIAEDDVEYKITLDVKSNLSKDTQVVDTTMNIYYKNSNDKFNLTINNNVKLEKNAKPAEINAANTIKLEDITDEEREEITSKFLEKIKSIYDKVALQESEAYFRKYFKEK